MPSPPLPPALSLKAIFVTRFNTAVRYPSDVWTCFPAKWWCWCLTGDRYSKRQVRQGPVGDPGHMGWQNRGCVSPEYDGIVPGQATLRDGTNQGHVAACLPAVSHPRYSSISFIRFRTLLSWRIFRTSANLLLFVPLSIHLPPSSPPHPSSKISTVYIHRSNHHVHRVMQSRLWPLPAIKSCLYFHSVCWPTIQYRSIGNVLY